MEGLTKRQREIVDFIADYCSEKRHGPSYRDIQHHFGFSSLGSVYNHIQSLKKRGALPENTTQARSLFLEKNRDGIEIPLIGKIKGGMPIETYPQVSMVLLPQSMVVAPFASYLLRVVGSDLEEEGIREGDLLLVQSKSDFSDKETILIQAFGQTTFVKRGFHDSPYIRLESANLEVHPLILRKEHTQILGVVISLLRNYSS
jgi:repressor LexA